MNFILSAAVSLFVFTLSSSASSARCSNKQAVSSETRLTPDGTHLNLTLFDCGEAVDSSNLINVGPDNHSAISSRSASECRTGQCVCGATCSLACFSNPIFPTTADCVSLKNNIINTMTGSFRLVVGQFLNIGGPGSCEFEFSNMQSSQVTLEYCWDDFANIGLTTDQFCPNGVGECTGAFAGRQNSWIVSTL